MSHAPDPELLSAYLDGELSPDERGAVERWLAEDPAARQTLDDLRAVCGSLQALPRRCLAEDLTERVLRQAERQILNPPDAGDPPRPAGSVWWHLRRRFVQPRSLIWMAVIFLVAIGLSIFDPARQPRREIAQAPSASVERSAPAPASRADGPPREPPSISAMPAPSPARPAPAAEAAPAAPPAAAPGPSGLAGGSVSSFSAAGDKDGLARDLAESKSDRSGSVALKQQADVVSVSPSAVRAVEIPGSEGAMGALRPAEVPAAEKAKLAERGARPATPSEVAAGSQPARAMKANNRAEDEQLRREPLDAVKSESAFYGMFDLASKEDATGDENRLTVVCVLSPQAAAARPLESALARNQVQRWGFQQLHTAPRANQPPEAARAKALAAGGPSVAGGVGGGGGLGAGGGLGGGADLAAAPRQRTLKPSDRPAAAPAAGKPATPQTQPAVVNGPRSKAEEQPELRADKPQPAVPTWELHAVMSSQQLYQTLAELRNQPQQVMSISLLRGRTLTTTADESLPSPRQIEAMVWGDGAKPATSVDGVTHFGRPPLSQSLADRAAGSADPRPAGGPADRPVDGGAGTSRSGAKPDVAQHALVPQSQLPSMLGRDSRMTMQLQTQALPEGADTGVEREGVGRVAGDKLPSAATDAPAIRVRFLVSVGAAAEPARRSEASPSSTAGAAAPSPAQAGQAVQSGPAPSGASPAAAAPAVKPEK